MTTRTRATSKRRVKPPWPSVAAVVLIAWCLHGGTAFSPSHASSRRSSRSHATLDPRPRRRPPSSSAAAARVTRSVLAPGAGAVASSSDEDDGPSPPPATTRSRLRGLTGVSLTACRAALRAATGLSLSGALSGALRRVLGVLPPGLRYFLQPLLVLYYAPLLLVRYYVVGPSREYVEGSRGGHTRVVEGWRRAVEVAEKAHAGGYWPVHLNDDGTVTTSLPPDPDEVLDLADGIEQSVVAAITAETSATA